MTQFAVSLKDGSILATSDEVYKIYTEHITYDPERGVTSFKGRTGAVTPQSGDYTAAQVGAIPAGDIQAVRVLTQTEYDALGVKSPSTLYLIEE